MATTPKAATSIWGDKEAAVLHDRLNLVGIGPLVGLTIAAYASGSNPSVCTALTILTAVYIVTDMFYHCLVPACQPNFFRWSTIMLHHLVTFWLVLHPCLHPVNADMTAPCTLVEINTLILTVNRGLKWKSLTFAFYFTWVTMRLVMYPFLVFRNHARITAWGAQMFDYHWFQTVATVAVLCALNWLWTFEVLAGKAKPKAQPEKKTK